MNIDSYSQNRSFVHLVFLEQQVHCVEIERREGRYSARLVVGVDELLLKASRTRRHTHSVLQAQEEEPLAGTIVATSRGEGFESLHDAFRSLRKDISMMQMLKAAARRPPVHLHSPAHSPS